MRAVEDAAAVVELTRRQRPEILVRQDLGEADDRIQRRAQFVGDVGDKLALQAAGGFQRLVALAQYPLDPRRVADVEAGQQNIAVGERHRRQLQYRAVETIEWTAGRRLGGDSGDDMLPHQLPIAAIVVESAGALDDVADMRLADQLALGQIPDLAVGRVMQFQPAVAAEQGCPLVQIVEGLALDLDQRVVGAFERQAVGHVLIDEDQAAQRVRRHPHAERPPVRQMHQLVLRLDQRGEQAELVALENPEIGIFGDPAALAQPLQHLVERGTAGEPLLLDAPQPGERGIEEAEPLVRAIDGDRGVDAFEHLAVRVDVPRQRGFSAFDIGPIDREADRAAGPVGQFADFEQAARSGDDDVTPLASG